MENKETKEQEIFTYFVVGGNFDRMFINAPSYPAIKISKDTTIEELTGDTTEMVVNCVTVFGKATEAELNQYDVYHERIVSTGSTQVRVYVHNDMQDINVIEYLTQV